MARQRIIVWSVVFVLTCCAGLIGQVLPSGAQGGGSLSVQVDSIKPGGPIPKVYANCIPAAQGHVTHGSDRSPAISWSAGPAGTASYAIITVDTDVPSVFTDANKEGKIIPASLKRVPFYHWVLVDISASKTSLPAGADSNAYSEAGKPAGLTPNGLRGVNSYPGVRGGYDGPCPPWNDAIVHHYHFIVYALNVRSLGLSGNFTGPDALKAMQGHVLAKGEVIGIYSLNPAVARQLGIW
jgi:Raf kinase inhibitor-like YbhB/YbcL family protein